VSSKPRLLFSLASECPVIVSGTTLALDLASLLGWSAGSFDVRPSFGSHQLPSTGEDVGRYIGAFDDWLQGTLDFEQPALVIYEAPSIFMKTTPITIEKLVGLAVHTQFVCHRRSIRARSANPSKVKKFWTGSGKAKKPEMVARAQRCGFKVQDDNEADAVAVWHWSVKCYGTKEQQDHVDQMLFEAGMGAGRQSQAKEPGANVGSAVVKPGRPAQGSSRRDASRNASATSELMDVTAGETAPNSELPLAGSR
jgi:crossover junction endodeoxyribonuclease RuvC